MFVQFKNKVLNSVFHLNAIRRSGHRGTSCLNWWMNFALWACSITNTPEMFLTNSRTWFTDHTGKTRWWRGVFEGDDSFCRLFPAIVDGDTFHTELLAKWERYGHRMKLIICGSSGEFCATQYSITDGKFDGRFCSRHCLKNLWA